MSEPGEKELTALANLEKWQAGVEFDRRWGRLLDLQNQVIPWEVPSYARFARTSRLYVPVRRTTLIFATTNEAPKINVAPDQMAPARKKVRPRRPKWWPEATAAVRKSYLAGLTRS